MEENEELRRAENHLKDAEGELASARSAETAAEDELRSAHKMEGRAEQEIREAGKEIRDALEAERHHDQILVEIATTSGFYPPDHPDRVPKTEAVEIQLAKAASALKLTNTSNWIASVSKRQINPKLSYEANGLKDKVVIDWGPTAGGGGAIL